MNSHTGTETVQTPTGGSSREFSAMGESLTEQCSWYEVVSQNKVFNQGHRSVRPLFLKGRHHRGVPNLHQMPNPKIVTTEKDINRYSLFKTCLSGLFNIWGKQTELLSQLFQRSFRRLIFAVRFPSRVYVGIFVGHLNNVTMIDIYLVK